MLTRYDPDRAPDPKRWLATPEADRIELARRYHRRAGIRPPKEDLHAAIHQIVETQVAMADETPAAQTLQRLVGEALTRHEAIHAIGFVVLQYMLALMREEEDTGDDPNVRLFAELRVLTADSWREQAGGDDTEEE